MFKKKLKTWEYKYKYNDTKSNIWINKKEIAFLNEVKGYWYWNNEPCLRRFISKARLKEEYKLVKIIKQRRK